MILRSLKYQDHVQHLVTRCYVDDRGVAMSTSDGVAWEGPVRNIGRRASGPTVQRIVLGAQLRRLREARNITTEQAAEAIRGSHSKISRMEHGRVGFKDRDVADLLTLYGVTDPEQRESLLSLARAAGNPGWWHDYGDLLPHWFEPYISMEAAASVIRNYEVQFVPGLLQTRSYAREVIRLGHPSIAERELDRRVDLRMGRQRLLSQPGPPRLWAAVDEAVLRRPMGAPGVMRGQVAHLIQMAENPSVTLQIVPFSIGGHSAAGGPFAILRFAEPELSDVVYLEQLTSALYLEKPAEADRYLEVMERLCVRAETAAASIKVLQKIHDELP
jgi:transcriptional regulator with XRE-family HTH domain